MYTYIGFRLTIYNFVYINKLLFFISPAIFDKSVPLVKVFGSVY